MTMSVAQQVASLSPAAAWSHRVRRVGGFIQLAFAAFWLVRGALSIGGAVGTSVTGVALVITATVLVYAVRVTAGMLAGSPLATSGQAILAAVISCLAEPAA